MSPKTPFDFSQFINNRIANIKAADSLAFALAVGVGPWVVPPGPAIIFSYALYISLPVNMADFRIIAAVSVAIGLIVAGAVSSHNAIVSSGFKPWSLVIGYIVLEIAGLWLMSIPFDAKIVGTVASLLTLIVYLSRSSAKEIDAGKIEAKEGMRLKLDYQIEQDRLDAEHRRAMVAQAADLKHVEILARIEAKKEKDIVSASVSQVSQESVSQVSLDRTFETLKPDIIAALGQEKPNMSRLARQLGVSRGTLYRHLKTLRETGEIIKNGNGYELPDQ
jgi:DNA-binding transcriptional ArsR family regulator